MAAASSPTAQESGFVSRLLSWGREKAVERRDVWPTPEPPDPTASFDDKLAFYRSQHTTKGVRATHLVGIPGAAAALPLLIAKPKTGAAVFVVSWLIQVGGHKVFEGNNPALTQGFVSYQLAGLAFWCEEVGDLVSATGLDI